MVNFVRPLLADAIVNLMAALSLGLAGYLFWLRFRERRDQRRQQKERERNRQKHWGYVQRFSPAEAQAARVRRLPSQLFQSKACFFTA